MAVFDHICTPAYKTRITCTTGCSGSISIVYYVCRWASPTSWIHCSNCMLCL